MNGMTSEDLARIALDRITADGSRPLPLAEELVPKFWDRLDEQSKMHMAVSGLGCLISAALVHSRKNIGDSDDFKKLIDKIHDQVECPFTSHETEFKKRRGCVGHIAAIDDLGERKAAIAALKKRYRESQKRFDECDADRDKNMNALVNEVADQRAQEILKGIVLGSADGTMKTLSQFTQQDAEFCQRDSMNRESGFRKRKELFQEIGCLLEQYNSQTIADLPPEISRVVADKSEALWSRKRSNDGA
jgi:hypothetical protein